MNTPPDRSWPPTEPLRYPSNGDYADADERHASLPGVSGRHVLPGDSSMPNDATVPSLRMRPTQWSIQEYTSAPTTPRTNPGKRPTVRRPGAYRRTLLALAIGALIGLVAGALIFVGPSLFGHPGSGPGHGFPTANNHNTPTPPPTPTLPPPVLTGSLAPTPTAGAINLTTEGTLDWAHWGLTGARDFDHKAHVDLISNARTISGIGPFQYGSYPISFSWSDGSPDASTLNTKTGIYMFAKGGGFSLTVPAGRGAHTVLIYVSVYQTQAKLTASLSDHSAPTYSDSSLINSGDNTYGVYTLTYRAASDGQALTITFTSVHDYGIFGNVALQSVALQ